MNSDKLQKIFVLISFGFITSLVGIFIALFEGPLVANYINIAGLVLTTYAITRFIKYVNTTPKEVIEKQNGLTISIQVVIVLHLFFGLFAPVGLIWICLK